MMSTAQDRKIPHLMAATVAPEFNMMKIEIPTRSATGHGAAMMIAREYLAANARCHGRPEPLRFVAVQ